MPFISRQQLRAHKALYDAARAIRDRVDSDLSVLRTDDWIGGELTVLDDALAALTESAAATEAGGSGA